MHTGEPGAAVASASSTTLGRTMGQRLAPRRDLRHEALLRATCGPARSLCSISRRPARARERIVDECRRALDEDDSDTIVLGCAGMADLCEHIGQVLGVPVVDGVAAGTQADRIAGEPAPGHQQARRTGTPSAQADQRPARRLRVAGGTAGAEARGLIRPHSQWRHATRPQSFRSPPAVARKLRNRGCGRQDRHHRRHRAGHRHRDRREAAAARHLAARGSTGAALFGQPHQDPGGAADAVEGKADRDDPDKGAFVSKPSVQEAREVFGVRRLLESEVVRLFVAKSRPADYQALEQHIQFERTTLRATTTTGTVREKLLGDFHVALAEAAGNQTLAELIRELVARSGSR